MRILVQTPGILASLYRSIRPRYLKRSSSHRTMSSRSYQDAVEHLNSLQSNAATLDAVRASGGRLSEFAIPEMVEYLERIGYTVCDFGNITAKVLTLLTDRTLKRFASHSYYRNEGERINKRLYRLYNSSCSAGLESWWGM